MSGPGKQDDEGASAEISKSPSTISESMNPLEGVFGYSRSDILEWSNFRQRIFSIISNSKTDMIVSACILTNIVIMIMETDLRAAGEEPPIWATVANTSLLIFYIFELAARLYVFRVNFFNGSANCLDFVIVAIDVIFELMGSVIGNMPNVTMLRLFRVLRALRFVRAVRSLVFFRELYMIMNGFFSAMKAIVWATVLLFVVLMIWSVVFVELVNPLVLDMLKEEQAGQADYFMDCERCGRAFSSTMQAMLTFTQQIVAGDEWGAVSIPIIEKHPWTVIFFSAVLVTVDLGLMNLILSVIVDKAQQAHNDDLKFQVQEKEEEFQRLKKQLLRFCAELDEDRSGCLTLDELLQGFDCNPEFHVALSSMDVQREDIQSLFNILDDDGSGHVEYDEFVDQLHKMKTQDSHVVLVFIRGSVKEIKSMMMVQKDQIQRIEDRVDANEKLMLESAEMIRTSMEGKTSARVPGSGRQISSSRGGLPQVYYQQQGSPTSDGWCCSPAPQEKSQDYMYSSPAPALGNASEEVKALKENIAMLNDSLLRIMGDGAQQLGGTSQNLLVQPGGGWSPVKAMPPVPPVCCVGGHTPGQEELGVRPLPAGDVVYLQQQSLGLGRAPGKGKGGKKGGKV